MSPNGATNTDRRCRLQLYEPIKRLRINKDEHSAVEVNWNISVVIERGKGKFKDIDIQVWVQNIIEL